MGFKKASSFKQIALLNPASRGGRTGRFRSKITSSLYMHADAFRASQFPGQMCQLAKESHMYNRIISIGGDGTICEILQGMNREYQQLAIVPAGTGNSIAKDLNLRSMQKTINKIQNEDFDIKKIDLLKVTFQDCKGQQNNIIASSMVALGYPAHVVKWSNSNLKGLGKMCYFLAAICLAGKHNLFAANIRYNNQQSQYKTLTGLLIGNTRHCGNFETFPDAKLDDGIFHTLELNNNFAAQNIFNVSLVTKTHFYRPVKTIDTSSMYISLPVPQYLMIDGEITPEKVTDISISCIREGVQCCI